MKKIITLILFGFINFSIFSDINSLPVSEIMKKAPVTELVNIAVNLSSLGGKFHANGDYQSALVNYTKSLELRKEIGLEKTKGYANTLHLKSIVEYKLNDSCSATTTVKKAISTYNFLAMNKEANQAEKEHLKEFSSTCNSKLSQN